MHVRQVSSVQCNRFESLVCQPRNRGLDSRGRNLNHCRTKHDRCNAGQQQLL